MGRLFVFCLVLLAPPGCAVVSATGNVIGAAGTLVGVTAKTAAGAIDAVAGGGSDNKKSDCADKGEEACAKPASN